MMIMIEMKMFLIVLIWLIFNISVNREFRLIKIRSGSSLEFDDLLYIFVTMLSE